MDGAAWEVIRSNLDCAPQAPLHPGYAGWIALHQLRSIQATLANYYPNIVLTNQATLTASQAEGIAKNDLNPVQLLGDIQSQLMVYPGASESLVAYQVIIPSSDPDGTWEYLVRADNGQILSKNDISENIVGSGRVYLPDPVNIDPILSVEPFNDLLGDGYLNGLYADVTNDLTSRASDVNNLFLYDPESSDDKERAHFDEANVYYHVNTMHSFFDALRQDLSYQQFPTDRFSALKVKARVFRKINIDKARCDTRTTPPQLLFGKGARFNDFATDADVIYHEYTHAIIKTINLLLGDTKSNFEFQAILEGTANYFAASKTNDPNIGEWTASKPGSGMGLYLYTLDNNYYYVPPVTDAHDAGSIWGGALWDLRTKAIPSLPDTAVDKLVIAAIPYWIPTADVGYKDFEWGLFTLFLADRTLNNGKYCPQIKEAFANHEIRLSIPIEPVVSSFPSDFSIEAYDDTTLTVSVCNPIAFSN